MTSAASTEPPAAARFSARISSDDGMALPDTHALSLVRAESDKETRLTALNLRAIFYEELSPIVSEWIFRCRENATDYARISC